MLTGSAEPLICHMDEPPGERKSPGVKGKFLFYVNTHTQTHRRLRQKKLSLLSSLMKSIFGSALLSSTTPAPTHPFKTSRLYGSIQRGAAGPG